MTYLEGAEAALASYDDGQITHAVTRIVLDKAMINLVGLLVDWANAGDPLYFPSPAPGMGIAGHRVASVGSWWASPV